MLLEIIELLRIIIMAWFVATIVYILLSRLKDVAQNQSANVKDLFCVVMSFFMCIATIVVIMLDILQVATLFSDTNIQPWVKEFSYLCVEFVWMIMCLVSISLLWKNVYDKQLIPGEGTVKERLKHQVELFKGWLRPEE